MELIYTKIIKPFLFFGVYGLLCLFIVSCSPSSDKGDSDGFTSLADCEQVYKTAYIDTYYDFVNNAPRTCLNCHSNPGVSHEFSIANANLSFENFLLVSGVAPGSGRARDAQAQFRSAALDNGHHSSGNTSYTALMDSYDPDWDALDSTYSACVGSF